MGNDIPMFITNPKAHITAGGGINAADAAPGTDLKPEMTNALEAGFEWRFFGDRLGINATYSVSYTHLDVYKRQTCARAVSARRSPSRCMCAWTAR